MTDNPNVEKTKMALPVPLEAAEKAYLSTRMADYQGRMEALQLKKGDFVSAINEDISSHAGLISKVAMRIREGDSRPVDCEVQMNHPGQTQKTITRMDTGESWVQDMAQSDYQGNIPAEIPIDKDAPPDNAWSAFCPKCNLHLHWVVGTGYQHDDETPACDTAAEPKGDPQGG